MTHKEFEHIAPELRDDMLSVGRNFFGNDADAEDIAQDGMLAMLKYLEYMDKDKNHHALAIRIAKHSCMDLVRKRKLVAFISFKDSALPNADAGASPQEELETKEFHEAITDAIKCLKPSERRLFELRQMEGCSLDDISKHTGIAKASVKSMLSAARKKVFNELKERIKS